MVINCWGVNLLKEGELKMFDSVQNSIWHAFDFLAVETNRVSAKKSKLKVSGNMKF